MINKLDLLGVPNFIPLEIYFLFGTTFSWNEGIDTCFNVKCVLLDHNFDFLSGYLVVTAHYLVVTPFYCSLLLVPTLLLVTASSNTVKQLIDKDACVLLVKCFGQM